MIINYGQNSENQNTPPLVVQNLVWYVSCTRPITSINFTNLVLVPQKQ